MVRLSRRVALDDRVDSLEDRYGLPADDDGDHRTVGDIVAEHPELVPLLLTWWERRHEPPDDLQASEAAAAIYEATAPPPPPSPYPKAGSPYDRPAPRPEEEQVRVMGRGSW